MGFFDDLGKKVVDAGQRTVQRTKEMSDVAHINSLITKEVNKVNRMYYQIGRLYISLHRNNCEAEFSEMVNAIAASEQIVEEYKRQIQNIKEVRCCKHCGIEVPIGAAFCSSCGNLMPNMMKQRNEGDYIMCSNCGNLIEKEAQFCTLCGESMNQSGAIRASGIAGRHCPKCGVELADDFAFCTECGTRL
jgi:predicted nucleic acid-binding Zn ribbon protein